MKVLIFAGAGTSIELGVPGMVGMGEEFLAYTNQWNVEPELVKKMLGGSLDIEHLIEALDRISTARASLEVIGQDKPDLDRIDKVRAEIEWFVQHAAERVIAEDARTMWGPVLRAPATIEMTLVTTNYDRAIELAANAEGVSLDDGFEAFGNGEVASWRGFSHEPNRRPLVKLHGSTDWYADSKSAYPLKLRHPMPLFGRATLRLAEGQELGSALVLPSREKLLTHDPYPRLSQAFLNAIDSCDIAVFVGSSLRDYHIRGAAQSAAGRVPVFLVNPQGDSCGVPGVQTIKQYASTFLVATLPNALLGQDPQRTLKEAAANERTDTGTLGPVRSALDVSLHPQARCRSLEELDNMGATLDPFLLRQLLSDQDPTVARYSLGLIARSAVRESLLDEAGAGPHSATPAFRDDVALLREMLQQEQAG